jgi:hypothetical protein
VAGFEFAKEFSVPYRKGGIVKGPAPIDNNPLCLY